MANREIPSECPDTVCHQTSLKSSSPQALQDVCVDIVALLSQMHHVLAGMPYPWRRALLERVKLLDHRFLGECLAVISEFEVSLRPWQRSGDGPYPAMCSTSLRAGTPLPQITPGPLVERLVSAPCEGSRIPTDIKCVARAALRRSGHPGFE